MYSLAGSVDAVIGVDTHRDALAAAVVTPIGAVLAATQAGADAHGYRALLNFAQAHEALRVLMSTRPALSPPAPGQLTTSRR